MSLPVTSATPTLDSMNRSKWMQFCKAMGTQIGVQPVRGFSTPANIGTTVTGVGFLGKLLYDGVKWYRNAEMPHFLSGFLTAAFGLSAIFFKVVQSQAGKITSETQHDEQFSFRNKILSSISGKMLGVHPEISDPNYVVVESDGFESLEFHQKCGLTQVNGDDGQLKMIRTMSLSEAQEAKLTASSHVSEMGKENIHYGLKLEPLEGSSGDLSSALFRCSIIRFDIDSDTSWQDTDMIFEKPIRLSSFFSGSMLNHLTSETENAPGSNTDIPETENPSVSNTNTSGTENPPESNTNASGVGAKDNNRPGFLRIFIPDADDEKRPA